jgi:hypothetical protein
MGASRPRGLAAVVGGGVRERRAPLSVVGAHAARIGDVAASPRRKRRLIHPTSDHL